MITAAPISRRARSFSPSRSAASPAAAALHGDMSQPQRNRTLEALRRGRIRLLVATDVAARGLDVADISHVINFDLPRVAEDYVHRIGRTGRAGASGIAIDATGNAYVVGVAWGSDFPTTNGAFQTANNGNAIAASNAYVTKLNPTGTALVYSTLLGGSGVSLGGGPAGDAAASIAIDSAGDVFVAGTAFSANYPTTVGAYQTTNYASGDPASNAFVTELNATGASLLYSTFLGGTGAAIPNTTNYIGDTASGIALDGLGGVYITGATASASFPHTAGSIQIANGGSAKGSTNGFASKFTFAQLTGTTTALVSSANPAAPGANVTFTATVAPASGNTVPTGNVAFSVDGATAATVALGASGTAA